MKRRREQQGYIFQARGTWYVRYFEDRVIDGSLMHVRIAKQLGPVEGRSKQPPQRIQDEAKSVLSTVKAINRTPGRVLTISDFVENVYFPQIEQEKRPSTIKGYRDIWTRHFKPLCEKFWLKDVRTYHVQDWLKTLGQPGTLSRNTLKHIKTFVSAVFKLAKQQGYYLGENPVRDTSVSPKAPEPRQTYAYSLAEIRSILAVLPEPAATVFAVAAYTGLRRGELQGLQWENYQDRQINVTRAIWEGHISEPKTQRSKGIVPVIKTVAERLDLYRACCGNPKTGPMFANQSGRPINLNNLLNRLILPALNVCVYCKQPEEKHNKATTNHEYERDATLPKWRGWHAARRGLGTNLYALGVPDKVIQEILRHSNVSTTNSYYIKTVPQQVLDAMRQLETAIPQVLTDNEFATRKRVAAVSSAVN